jgi:N-methylhydantoinase A/oxoprolinase/acetone carboxylase beta subunit
MISIDNGGTFTDICVVSETGLVFGKTPTTPYDLSECFREVLKVAAGAATGDDDIVGLLAGTELLRYSSTIGTNAIVEKKGPRLGLILSSLLASDNLASTPAEHEMWSALVGDRVRVLGDIAGEATFESQIVTAVNQLIGMGATRLVVSLGSGDAGGAEQRAKRVILRKYPRHLLGAVPVLFSQELSSDGDDRRRTWTALLNSFLHPEVERFFWNTEQILRQARNPRPMLVFHNDGNSGRVAKTIAIKTYSSGPRGGLEGLRALAQHYGWPRLIGMDVGGTTTDIGTVDSERIATHRNGQIAGIDISFPLARVDSTGIGGSSVFGVEGGTLRVGPRSVGAIPGPACFGRGGVEATITDTYLAMGVFDGSTFLDGRLGLDVDRARNAVQQKVADPLGLDVDAALLAMQETFETQLAATIPQAPDMEEAVLVAFGGAGPMSACAVAAHAGIGTVVVPRLAAVFSAFGVAFSDIGYDYEASVEPVQPALVEERLADLSDSAERDMFAEGFSLSDCATEQALEVVSDDGRVTVVPFADGSMPAGAVNGHRSGLARLRVTRPIRHPRLEPPDRHERTEATASGSRSILVGLGTTVDVPVYTLDALSEGASASGPAIVEGQNFTCRVLDGWSFQIDSNGNIIMANPGRADR